MNELENEDLVGSFEVIMNLFMDDIKPFAIDICSHLKQNYIRCVVHQDEGQQEYQ